MKQTFLVSWLAKSVTLLLLFSLASCKPEAKQPAEVEPVVGNNTSEPEDRLVINNATLEEVDDSGKTVWKMKADKTSYNEDNKLAFLENPAGNLYQDGKIILQVKAKKGEVQEDGKIIFLRDKIEATDIRNNLVFRADELEWRPEEDLVIVRKNLTASRPKQLEVVATEGRYKTKTQELDVVGKIAATSFQEALKLQTEHLIWQIPQKKLLGDKRIQIDRYKEKVITERVEADSSQLDLQTMIIILTNNVELKSLSPPLQVASNNAIWNTKAQTVISNQPIQVIHETEQTTVTGNEGKIDLKDEVVRLTNGVTGTSSRNQSKLDANQFFWDIPTQKIEAQGNVVYQRTNPPVKTKGVKAVGQLNRDNVVVTGGNTKERVVTEIIP
ncbi:MAG: LPS export ABC transporter periplasmic protein LptC [Spirulinaceae cyanobacterium]